MNQLLLLSCTLVMAIVKMSNGFVSITTICRSQTTMQKSKHYYSIPPSTPPSTPPTVPAMIERTFVMACMSASSGYVDELKMFIVAIKAGFLKGWSISQMNMELSQVPTQSANRPLMEEEIELRTVWMSIVYLTLFHQATCKFGGDAHSAVSPELRSKFNTFTYDVCNAHKQGLSLQTLKLTELFRRDDSDSDSNSGSSSTLEEPKSPLEEAVLSQCMRVAFLTLDVMKDEEGFGKKNNLGPPGVGPPGGDLYLQ